jgi:ABC-type uncharacterized transport system substrate-binding protein
MSICLQRRELLTLLGGAAAWPVSARAQQAKRVGVLMPAAENDPELQPYLAVLLREMQGLGWREGRTVHFEYRWAGADPERMRAYAVELIHLLPDLIFTMSNQSTSIVGQQTRTIPIVFAAAGDPVGTGLIQNMAHPGGNITGFTTYESEIAGKKLGLLKEFARHLTRVGVLYTPGGAGSFAQLRLIEAAAPSFKLEVNPIGAYDRGEMERAINLFASKPNGGLAVLTGPAVTLNRDHIMALAARHHLPTIYSSRYNVINGGLMYYGGLSAAIFRRAASYINRILKGEKPGNLPVQLETKFELVINLKTAKAIGLTVPPTLQALADEVIE